MMTESNGNSAKSQQAFVRRHSRLLTFVGALIVFTTFVEKEGLREHLKSVVESLETANNAFASREDSARTNSVLLGVADTLNQLSAMDTSRNLSHVQPQRTVSAKDLSFLKDFMTHTGDMLQLDNEYRLLVVNRLNRLRYANDDINKILRLLPKSEELSSQLKDTTARLDAAKQENDKLEQIIEKLWTYVAEVKSPHFPTEVQITLPRHREELKDQFGPARDKMSNLSGNLTLLEADINSLADKVLDESEQYKQSAQRTYDRYSVASYILYGVGWGLGLLGKMYGVEIAAE